MAGYGGGKGKGIGGGKGKGIGDGLGVRLKPSGSVSIKPEPSIKTEPRAWAKQSLEKHRSRAIIATARANPGRVVGAVDRPGQALKLKTDSSVSEAHKFMDSDSSAAAAVAVRKRMKSAKELPEPKLFPGKPGPVVKRS
jgi:hypothetical protein